MATNKAWTLASRPSGWVTEDNFKLVESEAPRPKDGEVLVRNQWLSLDPYMRGRMNDVKSYVPPVQIGEVMVGQTAGEVVESKHPAFKQGDTVLAAGWQLYSCMKGEDLAKVDAAPRAAVVLPRRARHARDDRLLRPERDRRAQAGRNRGGVGGLGRGRQRGRPAGQDRRLPRGRHRGRAAEVRATW